MLRESRYRAKRLGGLLVVFSLALIVGGLQPGAATAQDDPFADTPKRIEKPTSAPGANAARPASPPSKNPTDERIDFEVSVKPQEAKRGETVKLTIAGTLRPGFHTYPLTQRAENPLQDETALSKVIFENTAGLQPLWPVTES